MKLKSHLAKCLRRCGYAVALTVAAGSLLPAQETVIEYLTHEGVTTDHLAQQSDYELNLDLSMPEAPAGTTVWNTENILENVSSGTGRVVGWCPWRNNEGSPTWNYEFFVPNLQQEHYGNEKIQNTVTKVSWAIRPTLQDMTTGLSNVEIYGSPRQVQQISYMGARSVVPADIDARNDYWYFSTNELYTRQWDSREQVYKYTLKPYDANPIYNEDGTPVMRDGKQVYTTRSRNEPTSYYDKDGNPIKAFRDESINIVRCGDTYNNVRANITSTSTPVDVCNNTLMIDHAGLAVAFGSYSQWGNVYDNLTYIQDVRVSDDIFGSSAHRGDVFDNTLVVVRAQAIGMNTTLNDEAAGVSSSNYNNSGKVFGAYSSNKDGNDVCRNTTVIIGSSTYQEVGAARGGSTVEDNALFISRSEIATGMMDVGSILGGYSAGRGISRRNMVIIDDTFDDIAAGVAPEEPVEVVGGWNAFTRASSLIHEDVIGGRTNRGYGDNGAHDNKVIIRGVTAYDTNLKQTTTTTVEGNVFGGIATNGEWNQANNAAGAPEDDYATAAAASATGNIVSLTNAHVESTVRIPFLMGRKPGEELWGEYKLSVGVGKVIGGYVGAPVNREPGKANNNSVYLTEASVDNSVYGGVNVGAGEACGNQLHLYKVDTMGTEHTFFGGWIESFNQGGKGNNNHVILYKEGWSMDETFLHGAWGNEAVRDANGVILGKDNKVIVAGATDFDGTTFRDKDGATLATYQQGQVVNAAGTRINFVDYNGSGLTTTTFDGKHFYDEDGNLAGLLEKMAITITGNGTKDMMRAVEDIKVHKDASGNITSVDFVAYDENETVIATYHATGENQGKILGSAGVELASGIDSFDEASGIFKNQSGGTVASIARGVIVNYGYKREYVLAQGIEGQSVDTATGEITFVDKDGNTVARLTSSTITGTDANGQAVDITIPNETDAIATYAFKSRQGELSNLFSKISGFDEYNTYTRGNWLHLAGYQGKLRGFDHFEKLRFVFTPETDLTKPMVTITGPKEETALTVVREEGAAPTPVEVEVNVDLIADKLKPGDVIPVIGHEANEPIAGMDEIPKEVVDSQTSHRRGVTSTFTLDTEFKEWSGGEFDNFGVIEVMGIQEKATPESKALVEGRIATLTLNNMGGNLAAEQGIDSACRALENVGGAADANTYIPVAQDAKGSPIYAPKDELMPGRRLFFVMNAAHNKVHSGSDVDVDGTNALVGISHGLLEKNALTLGAFMETGWGKYHTHNNFGKGAMVPYVRGTGETSYVGAGALLRYRLEHMNRKLEGFSLDATIRAGRQETDYSTADLVDNSGNFASYEHESDYIAGHVGVNYTFAPADKLTATLYARYLWTHISADEGIVCGERVSFEDMSSNRIRLGGRLAWQVTENWLPYVGAAYEWEISGTARANTHGAGITAPSMRGGSVIGEIGAVWQPNITRALWIEGALQGSLGKYESYGAKLGVSIGF